MSHTFVSRTFASGACWLRALILWALGAVTLFSAPPLEAQPAKPACGGDTIATGEVARVVDGRTFVLADGLEVSDAVLEHGLLHIDLVQPEPAKRTKRIPIRTAG